MNQSASAIAPASIGNFITGFDTLGLAIKSLSGKPLHDEVSVVAADEMQLTVTGDYSSWVPLGNDNLVFRAAILVNRWLQAHHSIEHQWRLHLHKGLPVASGTGSSAASCVAAVSALCAWLEIHRGISMPMVDRWHLMAELEGSVSGAAHLDNLAPAVLGGLVLCQAQGQPRTLPFFDDWYLVLVYSGQTLKTSEARACLPDEYLATASIEQMQRLASLIDGLHRDDRRQVINALQDNFAEPYRASLLRGYADMRSMLIQNGALAVGISGAGPAFFAIAESVKQASALKELVLSNLEMAGRGAFVEICQSWYPDRTDSATGR